MLNALSFLLLVALGAVVWLARERQGAAKQTLGLETALAALASEKKDLVRRAEHESQARRKQSEELVELKRRSDKAKRRSEKIPEAPLGTAARIRDVELELERSQTAFRRVEAEREQHARNAASLQVERDALAKRVEDASAPARAVADQARVALERAEAELAGVREQCVKQSEELSLAKHNEARLRKRIENQEQLYASLRAELDVKKDRLRAQEEQIQRLEALKAAVIE